MKTLKQTCNCTIDSASDCDGCSIRGELECKFSRKKLFSFLAIGMPPMITTIAGLLIVGITTGVWWMLIAYAVFTFSMFGAVEMTFLCRHCPYYAAEGSTIVCNANYGSFKLLPYDPRPMNMAERFLMRAFVYAGFFLLPVSALGYGVYLMSMGQGTVAAAAVFVLFALQVLACIIFIIKLQRSFCTKCINFSCPFNTVSKTVVDLYLSKNRIMREAWEHSGYKLG